MHSLFPSLAGNIHSNGTPIWHQQHKIIYHAANAICKKGRLCVNTLRNLHSELHASLCCCWGREKRSTLCLTLPSQNDTKCSLGLRASWQPSQSDERLCPHRCNQLRSPGETCLKRTNISDDAQKSVLDHLPVAQSSL